MAEHGPCAVRAAIQAVYALAQENETLRQAYGEARRRQGPEADPEQERETQEMREQNARLQGRVQELEAQVKRLQAELRRR